MAPGGELRYIVEAQNLGVDPSNGSITISATLPAGVTAVSADLVHLQIVDLGSSPCTAGNGVDPVAGASTVACTTSEVIGPHETLALKLTVRADNSASGTPVSAFQVSGGGAAAAATTVDPMRVGPPPGFGVDVFDGAVVADAAGGTLTQAGGHPYAITTSIDFNTIDNHEPLIDGPYPVEGVKDLQVDLPPGLVGDPAGVAQCSLSELANSQGVLAQPLCPTTSQVGTTVVRFQSIGGNSIYGPLPVFNITPPGNVPARFGFNAFGSLVVLDAKVRSDGDYGLTVSASDIPEGLGLAGSDVTFWGVPSDPNHDAERACPGQTPPFLRGPTCSSGAPPTAFLRSPTSCTAPGVGLATSMRIDSWEHPGVWQTASFISHLAPGYPFLPDAWGPQVGITGCESVPFDPAFTGLPAVPAKPASPSGFAFDLTLPQSDDPSSIGESDLKTAVVTLPPGVSVNPSSANGLGACTSAQINLHGSGDASCPDSAKIGSVTLDTPLLRDPLTGSVFLATPHDNPFDSLLAIYLVVNGPGVVVKLAGHVEADPITGQLRTTFDNNPQLPFSRLHLEFNSGPGAPLMLPTQCGSYTTTADLFSWSGKEVVTTSDFTLSQDGNSASCPAAAFSPGFNAGTENPIAGRSSTFDLQLTRGDGDQQMQSLSVNMPEGLTGRIANAVLCAEGDAAAGTCPDGSKVGDVTVGAGAGSNPFYITNGRAYVTGPYKGAPFGLSIVVPAVAGPFDLGNVVVRSALFVDKHTSALRVVSDPLPTILQGIPLDVRDVRVSIDKPSFIVNPTSCAVKSVNGTITSTAGATANVSDRFQAADCASLAFKPRMTLVVGGKHHTHAGEPSPFTTRLTMPNGDANVRFVRVTLPGTINARLTVINDACTRAEFETDIAKCAHAKAGTAVAVTPLLRDPLRGNVYFVKNGHSIPDLFVALRGQVSFDLIGRITIPGGKRLATTFSTAPDVPIRSFTLRLLGDSKNGSVGAAANLCTAKAKKATAALDYIAQNGKVSQVDQRLVIRGCPKPRRAARHRRS